MAAGSPDRPHWVSNSVWSVAGNGFYAACQWALLVVLAKAGNPKLVGQYALGLALSAPLFLFASLQIRAIQSTDISGEFSFGEYLGLRLFTTASALVVLCGMAALGSYDADLKRTIFAVALFKAVEAVSDVFHGDLQRRERMDKVALYLGLKGLASVIAVGLVVRLWGSAAAAAFAAAIVFACVLLLGESRFAVVIARPQWNWPVVRRLIVMAFPLGLAMMLISVTINMPRYFVENRLGTAALGVFAALTYLSVAGSTLVNAVGLAATPRLARLFAEEGPAFRRELVRMSGMAALLGLAGMAILAVAGAPLLRLMYGPIYADRLDVAIWIMAGATLSYAASVVGYGLTAARCFRQQFPLFVVVTAVAFSASYLLVPRFGLTGAAGAQVLAAAAQLLGGVTILTFTGSAVKPVLVAQPEMAA